MVQGSTRKDLARKVFLFLLGALMVSALLGIAYPKRARLLADFAHGRVLLVHGCSVFSPGIFRGEDGFERATRRIVEVQRDGPVAMYDTPVGSVWYPVSAWTLPALVESAEADQYQLRSSVKSGDVVLDVGANVGTESRNALSAGASLVVAIEPDPISLDCLRRNLSSEIREKRVIVVPVGAWDTTETLPLHLDSANAGGASLVFPRSDKSVPIPLTKVDNIVADLKLSKVNVIKMHVEGAEQKALLGAAGTIERFHPRMAISLEHFLTDADSLPQTVVRIWAGYHVQLTPCIKTFDRIHPGVALLAP